MALQRQLTEQVQKTERLAGEFAAYKVQRKPWVAGRSWALGMALSWGDFGQAVRLLDWIAFLGGIGNRPFVVSVPSDLPADLVTVLRQRMPVQGEVRPRPFQLSKEYWPQGPNWSFTCVAQYCHTQRWDFFFIEPDVVPLKRGWLDAIEQEYRGSGRPFMGHFEPEGSQHPWHLAGVAVYNWEVYQRIHWHDYEKAWDVSMGPHLMHEAHQARTIQQQWGEYGRPPSFYKQSDLEQLRPDAVLFHRCKDGTLIDRLREIL